MFAKGKRISKTKGMGLKARPSHRAEVTAMFPPPTPHGWQRSKPTVHEAATGYAIEADAWPEAGCSSKSSRRRGEQSDSKANIPRPAGQSAALLLISPALS
jgi:hypothetical protein